MKKTVLLLAFLFTAFTSFAQDSYEEKAVELIKLSSGAQFDVMLQPLVERIPEENRAAFKKEVKESLNSLYQDMAKIYIEHYTEQEINKLLEFYHSPIGQKMLEETPEITQKSMKLGQAWGMQLQPIMAKYQK